MRPPETPRMTIKEFLDWAERQPIPYELVAGVPVPLHYEVDERGEIRAMAASSADHNDLNLTVGRAIDRRRPEGCRVLVGRNAVKVHDDTIREPDIIIACGKR